MAAMASLIGSASASIGTLLRQSIRLQSRERMLVLYDRTSPLAAHLADAYRVARTGCAVADAAPRSIAACDALVESLVADEREQRQPSTLCVDIDAVPIEVTQHLLATALRPNDLCVAIQSGSFQQRFAEYRLRLRLFERQVKMVEHAHLECIDTDQYAAYVDSLGFSPRVQGPIAYRFKARLDAARSVAVTSSGPLPAALASLSPSETLTLAAQVLAQTAPPPLDVEQPHAPGASPVAKSSSPQPDAAAALVAPFLGPLAHGVTRARLDYQGASASSTALEPALLNIGDFYGMHTGAAPIPADDVVLPPAMGNVGGSFPVGEVFSEAANLQGVNGALFLWGFPNFHRRIESAATAFRVFVERGQIVGVDPHAPLAFRQSLAMIREGEGGAIVLREFGVGINAAMSRTRLVNDVTAFERQLGFHVSLGRKHTVFKKSAAARLPAAAAPAVAAVGEGVAKAAIVPPQARGARRYGKFHIDVFAAVDEISVDGDGVVFRENQIVL